MNTRNSGRLGLMLAISGLMSLVLSAVSSQGYAAEAARAGNFRWSGQCQIRCADGRCQYVCATSVVAAFNVLDAKVKAEAALRAEARKQGTVIEGTVQVTVDLDKFIDQTGPLGSAGAIDVNP
jgi:hypothetical protein